MLKQSNKITLKSFLSLLCLFFTLLCTTSLWASPIKITLDGQPIKTSVSPILEKGTTLVPLRVISENLGAKVAYDAQTQSITITKPNTSIKLTIGSKNVIVNGKPLTLTAAPKLIKGTTMVPVRFISEHMGCTVGWEESTQTVILTSHSPLNALPVATITIRDLGTIQAELYPTIAPNTVNNFIHLANSNFYDGLTFHRVIEDFMVQGGCPYGTGIGGPGYNIPGEFTSNGFTNNLLHTKGVLSMARSLTPNSAGSQFFIMTADASHLDGEYAAFGKVISGLEVLEKIEKVPTDLNDKPLSSVIIESIKVDTKGINYPSPTKF